MNASELYKAGKLQAAIDAQILEVKAKPADPSLRLFLFELSAFGGDLDRAKRQIEAVKYDDAERDTAVLQYRVLLECEEKRRKLFRDGLAPRFLDNPPAHLSIRLEALAALRAGKPAEASALLAKANEQPALVGTLNDKPFKELRDADDLFGTVIEVMARGDYFWVALEQLESLTSNAPRFPRDLLYLPARLTTLEGEDAEVFLPTLYPNSHLHPDDKVKLGIATDWKDAEGGPVSGVGAKTFLVGDDGIGLIEWRELKLAHRE